MDEQELSQIKDILQSLQDGQAMLLQWVSAIDEDSRRRDREIEQLEQMLIDLQKHEYAEIRREIDDIRQQLQ